MPVSTLFRRLAIKSHSGLWAKNAAACPAPTEQRGIVAALAGLALAVLMVVLAAVLIRGGRPGLGFLLGTLSLIAACVEAVRSARYLARRGFLKRWDAKVEYELTREGAFFLLIVGLITIASVNTGNNLLFMILAILLAAMLVSGVLSKTVLAGLKLELGLPEHIFAGQPMRVPVRITNTKRLIPTYSVSVAWCAKREEGETNGASSALPAAGNAIPEPVYAPYIPARGSVKEFVELRFPRRGRYSQEEFQVSSKFPFSILRRKRRVRAGHDILVLPGVDPAREFASVFPFIRGEMEGARKGHGCDLYALRDYQDGDSARQVDWKATAKMQKLIVREFARQEEERLTIVFDARVRELSDTWLDRFEKGIRLCACLAWRVYSGGSDGSFLQFIGGDFRTRMAPASEIIYPVLEKLAVLGPSLDSGVGRGELSSEAGFVEGFPVVVTHRTNQDLVNRFRSDACVIAMEDL